MKGHDVSGKQYFTIRNSPLTGRQGAKKKRKQNMNNKSSRNWKQFDDDEDKGTTGRPAKKKPGRHPAAVKIEGVKDLELVVDTTEADEKTAEPTTAEETKPEVKVEATSDEPVAETESAKAGLEIVWVTNAREDTSLREQFDSTDTVVSFHQSKLELAKRVLAEAGISEVWMRQVKPCWIHATAPLDQQGDLPTILSVLTKALEDKGVNGKPGYWLLPRIPTGTGLQQVNDLLVAEFPTETTHSLNFTAVRVAFPVDSRESTVMARLVNYERHHDEHIGDASEPREIGSRDVEVPKHEEGEGFFPWLDRLAAVITKTIYGSADTEGKRGFLYHKACVYYDALVTIAKRVKTEREQFHNRVLTTAIVERLKVQAQAQ
ncbi:MAG: hypothetical protein AAB358_00920 [Patescibacteria group bacterium]|mgnify:FL=1